MWAGVNDYPEPEPDYQRDRIEAKIEQQRDASEREDAERFWCGLIQLFEEGMYDSH